MTDIALDTDVIASVPGPSTQPGPSIVVPEWTRDVRVDEITPHLQRELASHLDIGGVGDDLPNWRDLAAALHHDNAEIRYMEDRIRFPDSPTVQLLALHRELTLFELLSLIRQDLNRVDVLIMLQGPLDAWRELRQCSTANGVQNSPTRSVDSGRSSALRSGDLFNSGSVHQLIRPHIASAARSSSKAILVVYYPQPDVALQKLRKQLVHNLKQLGQPYGFCVECVPTTDAGVDDRSDRLDQLFRAAASIVILCSEQYRACVEDSVAAGQLVDPVSRDLRYMHRLMTIEYREQGALNRRFRPTVIVPAGSVPVDFTTIVPLFLRNTLVHEWPRQHSELCSLLFANR